MNCKEIAKQLSDSIGVAGFEKETATLAMSLVRPFATSVEMDEFFNVTAVIRPAKEGEPTVLLEAHLDEIGLIVTAVEDGFLRVAPCGGVDGRILPGQEMTVHTDPPLYGVISTIPPHLSKGDNDLPKIEEVAIDIGLSKEQAEEQVPLGTLVTVQSTFRTLLNDRISGKALDDRIGVVAILQALENVADIPLHCGLLVLFSAQEEVGMRGATMAGYRINADLILSLDVSFGQTPDSDKRTSYPLGEGVLIGKSAILTRSVFDRLEEIAKEKEIPHHIEVVGGRTGTNADVLGVQRGGAKIALLSIPQRYMHTPIETIDLSDVTATADLMTAYLQAEFGGDHQ